VILQVFAHAGQVVHQRDIELLQQLRVAHAGALQDLREAIAPAHSSTSFWPSLWTGCAFALQPLDAHRALAVKNNMIGQAWVRMVRFGRGFAWSR
jgi:hypothetical protein